MKEELFERYPKLKSSEAEIEKAIELISDCYKCGGKLLLCGNGGSCADCDHISGELLKGFLKKRPLSQSQKDKMKENCPELTETELDSLQNGLPVVSLPHLSALNSAFCNDVDPELIYAQSTLALGKAGDVMIAISTSGNAKNVAAAVRVAKGIGMTVIGLTGKDGGKLRELCDICIIAPENETFKIQEYHLPIYHVICAAVEEHFYKK